MNSLSGGCLHFGKTYMELVDGDHEEDDEEEETDEGEEEEEEAGVEVSEVKGSIIA